jgi:hypothetical protein
MRVVLATSGINMRRIDVTAAMLTRPAFEDAAYTALPVNRETNTAAGIFFQPAQLNGDLVSGGIAVIAPSTQVDKAYEAIGRRTSELVAPPTVFSGLDGIWVGIRHRTADVTLVANGRPVAYRQLRCGGLDTVSNALGDRSMGQQRLMGSLFRSGVSDPIADGELERYLSVLAAELRQTCDFWARSGESVPTIVSPYGAGGAAVGLQRALNEQGFQMGLHPELERRLVYLPAGERSAAIAGFLAAVTAGSDMPQVAFVNPHAIKLIEENTRRDRRARRILTGAVAAGIVSLIGGIPYITAQLNLRDARADLASAQEGFSQSAAGYAKLQDTRARNDAAEQILGAQPDWADALSLTFATMPLRAQVQDLSASSVLDTLQVRTTVSLPGGSYADLTRWLESLRNTSNVVAAWSDSFTDRDGRATFQVTFTLAKPVAVEAANSSSETTDQTITDASGNSADTITPTTTEPASNPTSTPTVDPSDNTTPSAEGAGR